MRMHRDNSQSKKLSRHLRTVASLALAAAVCLGALSGLSPQSADAATTAGSGTATGSGFLHTDGATIRTSSNAPFVIKATTWFGMETNSCAPHGLWSITLDAGLQQIKMMGFNTLRLSFSSECLAAAATSTINFGVNPALSGKTPIQVMDAVVASAKAVGLNVILDRHRPDSNGQSELWYTSQYSEARWISDWQALATRYRSEPTVIGFDLHNEPHGAACWGCGDPLRDWQAAATRGGNAVLSVNPALLMIIEGIQMESDASWTWWGGGLAGVAAKPVTLTVSNRVVYSPHDYPSSVFYQPWFTAANYPANLPSVWDKSWGYIAQKGIAPVLIGEFGTKLETASDRQWLSAIVGYISANSLSFGYWSFNPNSTDTGGLVKDDWVTPQTDKLSALATILTGTTPTPTPTPTLTPTPSLTPTSTPTPTPSLTPTPAIGLKVIWALQSSWGTGYVTSLQLSAATAASNWSVTWPDVGVTGVANSWGMTCSVKVKVSVTCTGSSWGHNVTPGQVLSVGLQVNSQLAPVSPVVTVIAQ